MNITLHNSSCLLYGKPVSDKTIENIVSAMKGAILLSIQEEKEREIERKRAEIQKEVASQKVDEQIEKPLTPPEVIKPVETEIKPQEEKIFAVQFKAYGTRQQLKQLKEFMKKEGIRYE